MSKFTEFTMRKLPAVLAAATMLILLGTVHAGSLAPAPIIIAEYDRNFIERSGAQTFEEMLDTGILRYFFTGGRNLLVMVNGRPYATTASDLDTIPLSAVERIEVLRAEGLGTIAGQAAVRGAFNLVLRKDLDGFDMRAVVRKPSRQGGEALQGSAVWGETIGADGHITVGIDIFERKEIVGSTREHSRSEWTPGGSFANSKNVSVGGNTLFVLSAGALRSVSLGDCNEADGYTGPLSNPTGRNPGDEGCGFAYGNFWWDAPSYKQNNVIVNLNQSLGENTEFRMDANFTNGKNAFRYAPSVGTFTIRLPSDSDLLDHANEKAGQATSPFQVSAGQLAAVSHRFTGHGNRDWITDVEEYDFAASVNGQLDDSLGYDAGISAFSYEASTKGNTFVDIETIGQEIAAGNYDLVNPLSTEQSHSDAIERSSLEESEDTTVVSHDLNFALEGVLPGIGARDLAWTAGVEFGDVDVRRKLEFRRSDGEIREVSQVLGSGGTSYAGKRETAGLFTEISLPITDSLNIRAAARTDDYDDIGKLHARRLGAEYQVSDTITLRSSLSTGDSSPSMFHLHSTASLDHPYVACIPNINDAPPRTCETVSYQQVKRLTRGNPDLKPSNSERRSFGFGKRDGPFYFVADWYRLTTHDLPGQNYATWAILNRPECTGANQHNCIERAAGNYTIHDSFANIVKTDITGLNTRFGNRVETDWGFVSFRGFWRYVSSSTQQVASVKRKYPLPRNAVRIVPSVGRGNLTAYWALNYRSEIENSSGDGEFPSWTGHDLTLDWKEPGGFENARLTFGVYNVTDAKLSTNTANPTFTDGPIAAGWGRTFFATFNLRF